MTNRAVALVAAVAGFAVVAMRGRVGDLGPLDGRLAASNDKAEFDRGRWRTGDAWGRGEMLADLARRHRFVGQHRDSVESLLGRTQCYVHYEDEPCYRVELDGRQYDLQFDVNHSNHPGRVLGVGLVRR
jgi:hypothetical protein